PGPDGTLRASHRRTGVPRSRRRTPEADPRGDRGTAEPGRAGPAPQLREDRRTASAGQEPRSRAADGGARTDAAQARQSTRRTLITHLPLTTTQSRDQPP